MTVDYGAAVDLFVAVIELAKRDATCPRGVKAAERASVQEDALEFIDSLRAEVSDQEHQDLFYDGRIPCRRRHGRCKLRWEFEETGNWKRNRIGNC